MLWYFKQQRRQRAIHDQQIKREEIYTNNLIFICMGKYSDCFESTQVFFFSFFFFIIIIFFLLFFSVSFVVLFFYGTPLLLVLLRFVVVIIWNSI